MAAPLSTRATIEDLAKLGDDALELVHGTIVERTAPRAEHSFTQASLGGFLIRRFHRGGGGRWPGGWWLGTEIHVVYASDVVVCHDLAGWRRARVPERPTGWATVRPDWVAEVLSPSHEKRDRVDKLRILHGAGVPHYWLVNAEEKILTVHRHEPAGYLVVLTATSGETVRAEPFAELELPVGVLFGDVEDDE